MINFEYRLYNFPAERLLSPRKKIPGSDVTVPKALLPFIELDSPTITSESDVIKFADFFTEEFDFNNIADFVEYVQTNTLYKSVKTQNSENSQKLLLRKVATALKYPFALRRMLQGLVADDTIYTFNLPYLAESVSDLEASFLLIENGYFKQSLQTLRNVIESTLAHAYFGLKGLDYEDLVQSIDFRMPPLRTGKNSLLKFLTENSILDSQLENDIIGLYRKLSGAVHSEISMLNSVQSKYDYDYLNLWYENLTNTGQLNLKLVLRMIEVGM